jgi:sporulation protein YlmC with PRC-barrel domain
VQSSTATTAALLALAAGPAFSQTREQSRDPQAGQVEKVDPRKISQPVREELLPPNHWRKGSDFSSAALLSKDNQSLGTFEDFVFDPATGRVVYGILRRPAGTEGPGRYHAIPWSSIRFGSDSGKPTYQIDMEANRFAQGPHFEPDKWPEFSNRAWSESVYRYYNQSPYWEQMRKEQAEAAGRSANGSNAPTRDAWRRHPERWSRLSEIRGITLRNRNGVELGRMNDVSIDPSTGRILFGVISRGERLHAVPWSVIKIGPDRMAAIDANPDDFVAATGFPPEHWPDMTDRAWMDEIHKRYHATPYWERAPRNESSPR